EVVAVPEQPATPLQSTLASAVLDALPSPSVTDRTPVVPRSTSVELSACVPDRALQPPAVASQVAELLPARSVPACTPVAEPLVDVTTLLVQRERQVVLPVARASPNRSKSDLLFVLQPDASSQRA